jgi:hypothetical protein
MSSNLDSRVKLSRCHLALDRLGSVVDALGKDYLTNQAQIGSE